MSCVPFCQYDYVDCKDQIETWQCPKCLDEITQYQDCPGGL